MSPIPVRRRCVFYVSGFDPKGAGHYHALYRDQAALQQAAGGPALQVGKRQRGEGGNASWAIVNPGGQLPPGDHGSEGREGREGRASDEAVHTHFEFLRWDDIVRDHWPRRQLALWKDVVTTTAFYLRTGALWRMFRLSWPPAVALFVPFLLIVAAVIGLPVLALLTGWAVVAAGGHALAGGLAGVAVAAGGAGVAKRLEARYSMYWMMRSYAFTALQGQGKVPALEARLDLHARQVAARLDAGLDDEVLVVGHSSGAIMAASILARALVIAGRAAPAAVRPRVSFLTLGQWLPLLGLLPGARAFRHELAVLAEACVRERGQGSGPDGVALDWIDFSAPPDGCCFALSDPIAACGIDLPGRPACSPKLLSPRFAAMFDAKAYAVLRRDKFRMHFQYLMASQVAVPYDYFAITAGSQTLADRFAGLPSVVGYADLQPPFARKRPRATP